MFLAARPPVRPFRCKSVCTRPSGFTNEQVGILLNHKTAKAGSVTGKHYNHSTYMPEKRKMIEAWSRHLESVLGMSSSETEASNVVELRVGA